MNSALRRRIRTRQRTPKGKHIPVRIAQNKIAHPILFVSRFEPDLSSSRPHLGTISIDLVTEHTDSAAAARPSPDIVSAKVQTAFAHMDTGVIAEHKVFFKAKNITIKFQGRLNVLHLQDRSCARDLHNRKIPPAFPT